MALQPAEHSLVATLLNLVGPVACIVVMPAQSRHADADGVLCAGDDAVASLGVVLEAEHQLCQHLCIHVGELDGPYLLYLLACGIIGESLHRLTDKAHDVAVLHNQFLLAYVESPEVEQLQHEVIQLSGVAPCHVFCRPSCTSCGTRKPDAQPQTPPPTMVIKDPAPQPAPVPGSYSIDMCAFRDDADGEVYVYFGGLWGGQLQRYKDNIHLETPYLPEGKEDALPSRCVRLTKDGLNFAEAPRPILVVDEKGNPLKADDPHRFFEASWMHKYKGKYYFSYSTGDSHLLCYATGENPYGPFTYQGVILTPVVGWTTHHSIIEYKGKWYLFHHDSVPSGGKSWLRSLKVCEIEYDAQGHIKTIEGIDKE